MSFNAGAVIAIILAVLLIAAFVLWDRSQDQPAAVTPPADDGLDDPEVRAYFRVLYGMDPETALADEAAHPHRVMAGYDPDEVTR